MNLYVDNLIEDLFCYASGLTTANYSELSHLYEKYKAQGMKML